MTCGALPTAARTLTISVRPPVVTNNGLRSTTQTVPDTGSSTSVGALPGTITTAGNLAVRPTADYPGEIQWPFPGPQFGVPSMSIVTAMFSPVESILIPAR